MKLIRYTREVVLPEYLRGIPGEQRILSFGDAEQLVMDGYAIVIADIADPEPPPPPSMEPIGLEELHEPA